MLDERAHLRVAGLVGLTGESNAALHAISIFRGVIAPRRNRALRE
jgi:hypothetical protein